jgi:large subunit ribosomal protein L10e
MATLRKANAYSKRIVVPYTRQSKKKGKSFIKTVPPQSIVKFSMGKQNLYDRGKLPIQLSLICDETVQIRGNALEACRQYVNKKLEKSFKDQYFFRVTPYPHHVQRENKMLTGAGSDRMQTGMQLSFGKSVGRSVIAKPGMEIFFVAVANKQAEKFARHLFHQIRSKLPCKTSIVNNVLKK